MPPDFGSDADDFGEALFSPEQAPAWTTETADAPANVGWQTSIGVGTTSGSPPPVRISYHEPVLKDLKLASGDQGGPWTLTTLDAPFDLGRYNSLVWDGVTAPRISYYQAGGKLKAHQGAPAVADPQQDLGAFNDIVFDGAGNPRISYTGIYHITKLSQRSQLRHAAYNGVSWATEVVDDAPVNQGSFQFSSIARDGAGVYHISYRGLTGQLRRAYGNTGSWTLENVLPGNPMTSSNVAQTSILAASDGTIHIFYSRVGGGAGLYHAWKPAVGAWSVELVALGFGIMTPSAALEDLEGVLRVAAYKSGTGDLVLFSSGSWTASLVDAPGDVGKWAAIDVDNENCLHISYVEDGAADNLKYATNWNEEGCFRCNDGNPCTIDVFQDGVCLHLPKNCDDGNICTTDFCDPRTGQCVNTPECTNDFDCIDGDLCTDDWCDAAGCCHSDPVDCDDGNDCTRDFCDPATGICVHIPDCENDFDCIDGDLCTDDWCDAAGCCHSDPVDCDDGNPCTRDSCDPDTGCVNTPECPPVTNCIDGDLCTTDYCDELGCCNNDPIDCDDDNPCTEDSCDPATGVCIHTPECPPVVNCIDGDLCTTDYCDDLGCCHNDPVDCDDDDPCTVDFCDPETGECHHVPECTSNEDCFDFDLCTIDWCDENGCCQRQIKDCDDGNPCTEDFCDPATGSCVHNPLPDGTICGPGGDCHSDICQGGECVSVPECGPGVSCPDPDPADKCVIGICNEGTGCCEAAYLTCGTSCCDTDANCPDDGNICTLEYCADGCCARQNVFDTMCFPQGGEYCHPTLFTGAVIDWDMDGNPDENCQATPAGAAPDTRVQRMEPNPDQGMPRTIDTEVLHMELTGSSGLGTCIIRESPPPQSTGKDTGHGSNSDFFIDSFFDVFFEIEFPDQPEPNNKHNNAPMRISTTLPQWPSPANYRGDTPVNLYDENNNLVGQVLQFFLNLGPGNPCPP
jgi:hypothetical protein